MLYSFYLYSFFIFSNIFDTMYSTGNSIRGPITSAIAISSLCGNELIAIARASGELRASVVNVRLA